jgi:hypothetical protein
MPQYEQFGFRDVPFFGDYNYISAAGSTVLMDWTDQRDTLPGTDPRYPVDGADGFDVELHRSGNEHRRLPERRGARPERLRNGHPLSR